MELVKNFVSIAVPLTILVVAILAHGLWRDYLRIKATLVSPHAFPARRRRLAARRSRLALLGTAIWVFLFFLVSLASGFPDEPNKWGDWAAGMFAPVAFLWLVLGYHQQGEELRLQAEELRNSVEQQTS